MSKDNDRVRIDESSNNNDHISHSSTHKGTVERDSSLVQTPHTRNMSMTGTRTRGNGDGEDVPKP